VPPTCQEGLRSAAGAGLRSRPVRAWRSAGWSRCCSATWSASPPGPTRPTPRTSGPCCAPTTPGCAARSSGSGAPGQVHRRRRHGRVRRPLDPRGRPGAGRPLRAGHPGGRAGPEPGPARPRPQGPHRRQHRRGGGGRRPAPQRGRGRRRGQHRLQAGGSGPGRERPGRRADLPGDPWAVRLRAAGSGPGQGKAGPLAVWRAASTRSRLGVAVDQAPATPFLGREAELERLRRSYAKAREEASVQLVTVSGEPGVGKSRLVWELRAFVDAQPELLAWRQGHCPPYGEGISFWALGEVLKAQVGVLEFDDRRRSPPSWPTRSRPRSRSQPSVSGSRPGSPPSSAWPAARAPGRARPSRRRASPPGAASWRRWRPGGRWWWC
jgi:hypothetical protein